MVCPFRMALKVLSLNILSDDSKRLLESLFGWVAENLLDRRVALHLSLLQRDAELKRQGEGEANYYPVGKCMEKILSKLEASFVADWQLMSTIFSPSSHYSMMTEIKFIQCPAVTNELLYTISLVS